MGIVDNRRKVEMRKERGAINRLLVEQKGYVYNRELALLGFTVSCLTYDFCW